MPIYTIIDSETGEEWDEFMSYSSLESFLSENPTYTQKVCAPSIISGVSGVTHKNDGGFKDLMNRIGNANPYSPVGEQYGDKGIKMTKNREVVKRQRKRQERTFKV